MLHFFLEYAVFFVILFAGIASVVLFTMTGRKAAAHDRMDAAHGGGDVLGEPLVHAAAHREPEIADTTQPVVEAAPETETALEHTPEPIEEPVVAAPEPVHAPAPEPEPAVAPASVETPTTAAPDASVPSGDDLLLLKGVGPKLKNRLNELGVTRFADITAWSDADVERIDGQLGTFKGRILRDDWIDQARLLASGDKAGFEAKYGSLGK